MPDEAVEQLDAEPGAAAAQTETETETPAQTPVSAQTSAQAPALGLEQPADELPAEVEQVPEAEIEPEVAFSWQASEYVHHNKSMMWYGVLALGVAALACLAFWLHLWLEIGVFMAGGGAIIVYARKPPRTLLYELSDQGVQIDGKLYPFSEFRSFGVIPDEDWHSIDLEPVKRFNPRMALLFDTANFEEIVGHLELHLPRADRELDIVERITRYVRF